MQQTDNNHQKIGVLAGRGIYPFLTVKLAKKHGVSEIAVVAIKGDADPELSTFADHFDWVYAGQLNKAIKLFRMHKIEHVIFAGQVKPGRLFRGLKPDFRTVKLLGKLKLKNAESIFSAIADEFLKDNITILPATMFLSDYLAQQGTIGKIKPTKKQLEDITFGTHIGTEISRLDIGQTVVVKNGTVLAVEGFEGTNKAIIRGGQLGQGDAVVVKLAKPDQDMRFDVPCIGVETIQALIEGNVRVVAIQAEKTLILEKDEVIETLNKKKISIFGINRES